MTRCLALLSGSLDSILAIRLMQDQGIDVMAVTFQTWFTCSSATAQQAAEQLNVPLVSIGADADLHEQLRHPRFGWGRGANPCIDCRIQMLRQTHRLRAQYDASFIVTGELLGQRPFGQKRSDLEVIAHHAATQHDDQDRLLRPLSAQLLPVTLPERANWVDRQRLFGFSGQGRRELLKLAQQYQLEVPVSPQTACRLTEPAYGAKVFDLLKHQAIPHEWDYRLLAIGRHFRLDSTSRAIVGRNAAENAALSEAFEKSPYAACQLATSVECPGPSLLHIGPPTEMSPAHIGALLRRFTKLSEDLQLHARILARHADLRGDCPDHQRPDREGAATGHSATDHVFALGPAAVIVPAAHDPYIAKLKPLGADQLDNVISSSPFWR